jgi:CheY-like chemotaxis protein
MEKSVDTAKLLLRILVVDDEAIARGIVSKILSRDGHAVETASNGREGLEKFQTGGFDVVITDGVMPEMNGEQMAAAIKQVSPHVPIIMLSGYGVTMKAAGESLKSVDVVLSKPITPTELREALSHVM